MNEEEFKEMVMPGGRAVYAWACRIVGADDASDIVQESLRRLWERRHELAGKENISAYMMMTAKNLLTDILRERQNLVRLQSLSADEIDSESERDSGSEGDEPLVKRLLRMLPDNQQTVVRMSLMAEMSNSHIAEATGLSNEAVRQNLSRGRKRLRELLKAATK